MSITGYEPIMEANSCKGLTHTAGMTTAQAREYQADQIKRYEADRKMNARNNGFSSVVEYETETRKLYAYLSGKAA